MRLSSWVAAGSLLMGAASVAAAADPVDPEIVKMVADVSVSRIQRAILVLASSTTRHTFSDPLPSGDGIGGAGAWIRAELLRIAAATGGNLQIHTEEFTVKAHPPRVPGTATLFNYTATLPGSQPGRIVVVSAHYDSKGRDLLDPQMVAPGADDNASGVAAVLAAARALAPYSFGPTVVFLLSPGGEQGSLGAAHWAEDAHRKGLVVAGVIDADEIGNTVRVGGGHERSALRVYAGGDGDGPAMALARFVRTVAETYVPSAQIRIIFRPDRFGETAGHGPFLDRGDPAVRLAEAADDPGSHADTPDYIDFAYVTQAAQVMTAAAAALARAPAPPQGAVIGAVHREPPTIVAWKRSSDPAVAGYRVVWRDTLAAFWTGARDLPRDAARTSFPELAPDDFVFGVEAFDAAGHVSLAAPAH